MPILDWGRGYGIRTLASDLLAALIVTVMLIPQSLAYALLAGLPPQVGLYASILPLVAYAAFGTSRVLSVGPVAVLSLMTAAAASRFAVQGSPEYIAVALSLALLSGLMLLLLGLFRLGFLANFISHPVVSGFITASGVLIAASQLRHLFGIDLEGYSLHRILGSLATHVRDTHLPTLAIGVSALGVLYWARTGLASLLNKFGVSDRAAAMVARAVPVVVVVASIVAVALWGLDARGVAVVGAVPTGLPSLALPTVDPALWRGLIGSAALIAVIGFVESVAVAQTLAAKRRQRIDPDQELVGLGAANLAAGVSGGYPVTGGFARSAVNFDAGAETPAAGAFTAVGIMLAALYLTPWLYFLPKAVLAATIIVAVLSLIDLPEIRKVWAYSRGDFSAMAATIAMTLGAGVEAGVATGVALSLMLHLHHSSCPHFAVVGQVPGTHHFRNVNRHAVVVSPRLLTLRIDESLYFANARFLEDTVYTLLAHRPDLEHLVLMCPAVNRIDASALDSLEAINARLADAGVTLSLSEVKGPVADRLRATHFFETLSGQLFLDQFQAVATLDPDSVVTAAGDAPTLTRPDDEPAPSQQLAGLARRVR